MGTRAKESADPVYVRTVMCELALSGPLSITRVAAALDVSQRTLQRRLSCRNTTFRALVADVRLEAARTLLVQTDLLVHEIAERLGYRTHGAFARAFLGWTGRSPRDYRRNENETVARNGQNPRFWRD